MVGMRGPVDFAGYRWVGSLESAFAELWRRDDTGAARPAGPRLDLLSPNALPALAINLSDIVETPTSPSPSTTITATTATTANEGPLVVLDLAALHRTLPSQLRQLAYSRYCKAVQWLASLDGSDDSAYGEG